MQKMGRNDPFIRAVGWCFFLSLLRSVDYMIRGKRRSEQTATMQISSIASCLRARSRLVDSACCRVYTDMNVIIFSLIR